MVLGPVSHLYTVLHRPIFFYHLLATSLYTLTPLLVSWSDKLFTKTLSSILAMKLLTQAWEMCSTIAIIVAFMGLAGFDS